MLGYGYTTKTVQQGHQLPNPCPSGDFMRAFISVSNQAVEAGLDVKWDNTVMIRADEENIYIYFEYDSKESHFELEEPK